MSRLVNVPSRFAWPHEKRGGRQFRWVAAAAVCSAGTASAAAFCAPAFSVHARPTDRPTTDAMRVFMSPSKCGFQVE